MLCELDRAYSAQDQGAHQCVPLDVIRLTFKEEALIIGEAEFDS